ncbi:hypothetical protein ABFS82_04G042800 [Erythranthe guttata]|nr:PREDICTED: protein SCARECROW-like [Erythranthe guttata]|eukprot:XP_012835841.1 PREDICTED: protein SCARECROW-like [Erythranthe guttata]
MQPQHELNPAGDGFSGVSSVKNPAERSTELSRWVEHVTKQLIEDLPENENHLTGAYDEGAAVAALLSELRPRKIPRNSPNDTPGSHHHWSTTTNNLDEFQNAKRPPATTTKPPDAAAAANDEPAGLNLITLLLECAVAVSVDNLGEARRMLLELTEIASPYSASCAERVVAYFAKAMSSRVINSWIGVSAPLVHNTTAIYSAFQIYNNLSPFVKFSHFTSNQAILEAFHRQTRVHIIDIDIMQGLQWPALFHILSTRPEGPPHVRMTAFGPDPDLLSETGRQLSVFAKRVGIRFDFRPINKKCGEIEDIPTYSNETVAVHWMQHSLYDAAGPDRRLMGLLHRVRPRVVTLVEQEIAHGGSFLDRFVVSLHYYSTMFDSIGSFSPVDDPGRYRVEQCLMHREINNVLAVGGPARSGEDKYRHWRSELSRNGFSQIPMSSNSMAQAQLIVNMFPNNYGNNNNNYGNGYSLVQGDGILRLGWKDTSLYTASAWTSPNSFKS